METVMIKRERKDLGTNDDSQEMIMHGQLCGYENCNGIAVLTRTGEANLHFLELNPFSMNLFEISNEEDKAMLTEL